jgi:hypothetical protein
MARVSVERLWDRLKLIQKTSKGLTSPSPL